MTAFRRPVYCISILLTLSAIAFHARAHPADERWNSRPVEIRGVWMDRGSIPSTEDDIRALVRRYARAGINLLHPEVIFNGYSMYPSSYLTQSDRWGGLDVLGIIIDEAHKHDMEVHPWVWVFRVGNANDEGAILRAHPEWVAVNKAGESLSVRGGYWLCPSIPAPRRFMLGALRELAQKYPVDGIQLDYIRFENQSPVPYCYNDSCRRKFEAEYGIDPLQIESFTEPVVEWWLWREKLVNTFVAEVSEVVRTIRPEVKISAAVGSDPEEARQNLLQDWEHWAANRWVDFLAPMSYTANSQYFVSLAVAADDAVANRALLAPGIGLYTHKGSETMLEQVCAARAVPVSGVTLFATAYLDADRLGALRAGPFKKRARLPFRSPVESARCLASSARERLEKPHAPAAISEATAELTAARDLLKYGTYQTRELAYVAPRRPPIFIPKVVQPAPSLAVPMIDAAPTVDGELNDLAWRKAAKARIEWTNLGYEVTQSADALLAYDGRALYIAFRCAEPRLQALRSDVAQRDGPVHLDDSIEIFLQTEEWEAEYAHLAVNAAGTKYDSRSRDASWDAEWQGATGRESSAWTVEAAIPFDSLKTPTPGEGTVWRANFCRNRVLSREEAENACWSPTYGSHHTPVRFGKVTFVEEVK